jgi:hypothetical protein
MNNMELQKGFIAKLLLCFASLNIVCEAAASDNFPTTQISSSECFDNYGQPRVSVFSH